MGSKKKGKSKGGATSSGPQGGDAAPGGSQTEEVGLRSESPVEEEDAGSPALANHAPATHPMQRKLSLTISSRADESDVSGFFADAGPPQMTPTLQEVDSMFAREVEKLSDAGADAPLQTAPSSASKPASKPTLSLSRKRDQPDEGNAASPPESPQLLVTPSVEEIDQRFEEELALLRQTHAQKDAPLKPEAAKGPAQPVQGMGKAQGLPAKPSAQGQPSATAAAAVPAASAAPTQAAARDVQPRNTAAAVPAPRPAVSDNVPRQEGVPRPGLLALARKFVRGEVALADLPRAIEDATGLGPVHLASVAAVSVALLSGAWFLSPPRAPPTRKW